MAAGVRRQEARRKSERPAREAARPRDLGLDGGVVSAALLLLGLGAVMIYSTTAPTVEPGTLPPFFLKQVQAMLAGAVLAALAAMVPLRAWHSLALPLWGISVVALVATLAVGIETNGAKRWLGAPSVGLVLQPGEFAKFATVLAVAAVLSRRDVRTGVALRRILAVALLGALPAGLLVLQPDLGNAVLLLGLSGLLLFVAGMDLRLLAAPALVGGVAVAVYVASHDYAWVAWWASSTPGRRPTRRATSSSSPSWPSAAAACSARASAAGSRSSTTCPKPTRTSSSP